MKAILFILFTIPLFSCDSNTTYCEIESSEFFAEGDEIDFGLTELIMFQ
jgi:hypothetical protein